MTVETPKKYLVLVSATKDLGLNEADKLSTNNREALISFQTIIDLMQEFKDEHPQATKEELSTYTLGLIKGRTKHTPQRRK